MNRRSGLLPQGEDGSCSWEPAIAAVYIESSAAGQVRCFGPRRSRRSSQLLSRRMARSTPVLPPTGRSIRIRNGSAEEYFAPEAKYIWSLAVAQDGSLYVGVGDNGRVYRVTSKGMGEVWFETGQSHVTALTIDKEGRVLAGTEPNGLIYRLYGKDKAFVLYDSNLPEIRTLVTAPDGSIYAAALGGSVQQRTNAAGGASQSGPGRPVTTPTTTITVTDEAAAAQAPPDLKPKNPESAKPARAACGRPDKRSIPLSRLLRSRDSSINRLCFVSTRTTL